MASASARPTSPPPPPLRGTPSASSSSPGASSTQQQQQQQQQQPSSRRQISLTSIVIPTVLPFRAHRADSAPTPSPNSIRRKPVGSGASPRSATSSADLTAKPRLLDRRNGQRSASVGSPQYPATRTYTNGLSPLKSATSDDIPPRNLDEYPRGTTPIIPNAKHDFHTETAVSEESNKGTAHNGHLQPPARPEPARSQTNTSYHTAKEDTASSTHSEEGEDVQGHNRTPTMSMAQGGDGDVATLAPKSPSSGWFWGKSKDKPPQSPATTFSDSLSPAPSPNVNKPLPGLLSPTPSRTTMQRAATSPLSLDIPKANGALASPLYGMPGTPSYSVSNAAQEQIDELQRELREVSSELANSIRREMELEDELERWKAENPGDAGKRTSDYYSDSGASSVRFPIGDSEHKLEELERIRRKVEQDKANMKVEMGQRLQTEMQRRKEIESQFVTFQEQRVQGGDPERQRELEHSLQQAQRKLAEERQSKENYEDLLNAVRGEVEGLRNERDNLKDEVVPALRARVEGLEADVSKRQSEAYDHAKLQQEMEKLRVENESLTKRPGGIKSITEETDTVSPMGAGLGRNKSMARSRAGTLTRVPSLKGLGRSDSVKGLRPMDSPGGAGDTFKELEEQRDALHQALKALLSRQELQQREFSKRLQVLQDERDKAAKMRPRGTSFRSEVAKLKDEMGSLRRRADDALEQKWQCEKGLSGLRMDLDRAHQETSDLRGLLQQHDIPLPTMQPRLERSDSATSLDRAYKELRTTHALSLARVLEMENESGLGAASADAQRTLQLLKQSISDAEAERESAQREAESYRLQARALQKSEVEHLSKEQSLAAELYASAARMDSLAAQVEKQLAANRELRSRLAEAVGRGEREQKISASRIVELQAKLRELEDRVTSAQQHSEDVVATHEEEVRQLKETHHSQLQRLKSSVQSPARFSFLQQAAAAGAAPSSSSAGASAAPTPLLGAAGKAAASMASGRSRKGSSAGMTMAEASRTEELERRVGQLERALKDADSEMEEVVGRMNMAQIEVAELQAARDEAMMQTRRLQSQITAEREKVKQLMSSSR